ncbi:MAG: hypothetical protein AABW90_01465 [Nanoarchaeota archaeon]
MAKLKNLSYRIKRFFMYENGIVEKVEEFPKSNDDHSSLKDSYGNLPQFVTFRNHLGELKIDYATEERVKVRSPIDNYTFAFRYRRYKVGDKFP